MASSEGITEKVYSPYSAFVAMLLTTLLSKESTKAELLHALQFETVEEDSQKIAQDVAKFLLETEYSEAFYNPAFDAVLECLKSTFEVDCSGLKPVQKTWLYATALRTVGPIEEILAAVQGVNQEKAQEGYHTWDEKFPCTKKLHPLANIARDGARGNFVIAGANRLWPNAKMNLDMSEFAILTDALKTPVTPVQFPEPGVSEINRLIEEITNGLIKDLLSPGAVSADTSCVLTNAIYFNGKWDHAFKKDNPAPCKWTMLDGSQKDIGLMHQEEGHNFLEIEGAKLVTMRYRASDYTMVFVLPNETGEAAFRAVAQSITPEVLERARNAQLVRMRLLVPKFKTKWGSKSLKQMLQDLGAHEIFTGDAKFVAKSCVSDVIQQAYIKVDEDGTEAAAATAVMMMRCAMPRRPDVEFKCDHPFMYFITNAVTGAILFMGSCIDPKNE